MKFEYKNLGHGFLTEFSYEKQKETLQNLEVVEKDVERVVEKVVENLNYNQQKILFIIKDNPSITASEISKQIDISIRKTQENIAKLKSSGLLVRIGPDRGGHWEVLAAEESDL